MAQAQVRFYPDWFFEQYGMVFGERYARDPAYRVRLDCEQQRVVAERFGDVGLGSRDPKPEPNLRSVYKNLLAVMFGCRVTYSDRDDGWVESAGRSAEALIGAGPMELKGNDFIAELDRQAQWFFKEYGPAVLNPGIDGILNVAVIVCGEEFFALMSEDPAQAGAVLGALRETAVRVHEHYHVRCGTSAPMGLGNCSLCMIRPETYATVVWPHDAVWYRRAQSLGLPFGFHMDGKIDRYLDVIKKIPYLHRVDMGCDSDVGLARRTLGNKILRLYLYPHWLREMTPEQTGTFLRQRIQEAGSAGELVFQLDVCSGLRDETVRTVVQVCKETQNTP